MSPIVNVPTIRRTGSSDNQTREHWASDLLNYITDVGERQLCISAAALHYFTPCQAYFDFMFDSIIFLFKLLVGL